MNGSHVTAQASSFSHWGEILFEGKFLFETKIIYDIYQYVALKLADIKGQLISKCLFGVIVSNQIAT